MSLFLSFWELPEGRIGHLLIFLKGSCILGSTRIHCVTPVIQWGREAIRRASEMWVVVSSACRLHIFFSSLSSELVCVVEQFYPVPNRDGIWMKCSWLRQGWSHLSNLELITVDLIGKFVHHLWYRFTPWWSCWIPHTPSLMLLNDQIKEQLWPGMYVFICIWIEDCELFFWICHLETDFW